MKKFLMPVAVLALPFVANAASGNLGNLKKLLVAFGGLVSTATPIVVAIGLLVFFWGLVKISSSEPKSEAREAAWNTIWTGIIILFVMVSIWGLVRFVGNALDIEQGGPIDVPSVPL